MKNKQFDIFTKFDRKIILDSYKDRQIQITDSVKGILLQRWMVSPCVSKTK